MVVYWQLLANGRASADGHTVSHGPGGRQGQSAGTGGIRGEELRKSAGCGMAHGTMHPNERVKGGTSMGTEYVQHRDGNIYVGPSRVTIDSVVINWRDNKRTPEQIHESFPSVPLANIYGAIAYYLDHQDEIDAWIREGEEIYE